MKPGLTIKLADEASERCNRNHRERIDEVQDQPLVGAKLVKNVLMPDSVAVPVNHGLGRVPVFIVPSAVRPAPGPISAGVIEEIRDGSVDRSRQVLLKASGYGGTVIIDLAVA